MMIVSHTGIMPAIVSFKNCILKSQKHLAEHVELVASSSDGFMEGLRAAESDFDDVDVTLQVKLIWGAAWVEA